jgi:hypothetical protein
MKKTWVGVALALLSAAGGAQTTLTTTLKAPVTAVAIGPSRATVEINVARAGRTGSNHVSIRRPVTAIATPLRNVRIRIN